jgi:tyrosine-protein phosphatase YwqE
LLFFKTKLTPLDKVFPKGFTDIHSHILPGIDDGAKNMNASIKLIEKFKASGITNLITTPHIMGDVWPNTPEIILQKLDAVNQALIAKGLTDIKLRAAAEYLIDDQFSKLLKQKQLLTLKHNLVLVELSYFNPPANLYEVLFDMQIAGYKPILAHPERYVFYHSDISNFDKLKKAGCLFQLNLLSLTKHYGKQVQAMAMQLLKQDYYDFVGSDAHRTHHLDVLTELGEPKLLKLITPLLEKNLFFS